ncbi:MAG TPA: hypothetical protein VJ549_02290, partial [Geothrix sp.]|nr:hypothetical protein [Geothrix sp.]
LLGEATVLVARDEEREGALVGACACTWMPVHVNGAVVRLPYLAGLRLAPAYRHRAHLIREGFRALDEAAGFGSAPFAFTSLARDNQQARRLLEAGLAGFPHYAPLAELETFVLPASGQPTGRMEPACPSDVPELVGLINERRSASQLSPHLSEEWLAGGPRNLRVDDFLVRREGGGLQACVALWDQRAFKQARIHGYRPPLNLLRGPWNLVSSLRRGITLPAPGTCLEACFLAFANWRDESPEAAASDITEALAWANERGIRAGMLGLPAGSPLGACLQRGRAPWIYGTCIEAVRWPEAPKVTLEPWPIHPEIALL